MRRLRKLWSRLEALGILGWLIFAASCGAPQAPAQTDVTSVEAACAKAVDEFQADHGAGMSCEAAKAKVLTDNPTCKLAIHCKDGGQ